MRVLSAIPAGGASTSNHEGAASPACTIRIVGGVDTHGDTHVAAVVDTAGRILGIDSFLTDSAGERGNAFISSPSCCGDTLQSL